MNTAVCSQTAKAFENFVPRLDSLESLSSTKGKLNMRVHLELTSPSGSPEGMPFCCSRTVPNSLASLLILTLPTRKWTLLRLLHASKQTAQKIRNPASPTKSQPLSVWFATLSRVAYDT